MTFDSHEMKKKKKVFLPFHDLKKRTPLILLFFKIQF